VDDAALRELMKSELPEGLLAHIDRVVELADDLARRHGLNVSRVRLAAQGHDLLRAIDGEDLLARAERRGMTVDPVERTVPVLLHGPLGSLELRERFGVDDDDALDGVWWHTTGHPEFSRESWAIFVADKVEPSKVRRSPKLAPIRELADKSLEEAALAYLDYLLAEAVGQGWQVHPMSVLARNSLIERGFGGR